MNERTIKTKQIKAGQLLIGDIIFTRGIFAECVLSKSISNQDDSITITFVAGGWCAYKKEQMMEVIENDF
jgi:hypothetical protein